VYEYTTEVEGVDVDQATLFVGTMEGTLIAYDLEDNRDQLWKITFGSVLYGRPFVSNGFVYITTASSAEGGAKLFKVNADTGAATSINFGGNTEIVGGAVVALDTVYVGVTDTKTTDGALYAYTTDLVLKWKYPAEGMLSDRIWTTPTVDVTAVDAGVVYFGCFDNNMYALDAVTGEEVWDEPFEAGGAIASKPLVYDGAVYFGSFDRKFYAVDKTTGVAKWTEPFVAGNWFWAEAIANDGTIYVGSLDHKLYALDATTGTKKSEFLTDGEINTPPVLVGDTLVVASKSNDGVVYGRGAADLAVSKWASQYTMLEAVQSPMSVYGDHIYIYGLNSKLVALRIDSGGEVWKTTTS
jgi:outer membrane protein assembly factor BamB